MSLKDKLFNLLLEQDLYLMGESETFKSERYENTTYKITCNGDFWTWEEYKGENCVRKLSKPLSRIVRKTLNVEKIEYYERFVQ